MYWRCYGDWLLLALFYAYQYLLRIYPGNFVNEIRGTFSISADEFATMTACCVGAYSCLQIPFGILLDRIGIRTLVLLSFGLCLAGQYLFSQTQSLLCAQIARILMGIGGAPSFMSAVKLISDGFYDKQRGLFIGLTTGLAAILGIFGNLTLKKIALNTEDWQAAANCLNGLGLGIFILCFLFLSKSTSKRFSVEKQNLPRNLWLVARNYKFFLYAFLSIGTYSAVITLADLWGPSFLMAKYQLQPLQAVKYNQWVYIGFLLGSIFVPLVFKNLWGVRTACFILIGLFAYLIYGSDQMSPVVLLTLLFTLGVGGGAYVLCFALAAQLSTPQTSGLVVGWVNTINMLGVTGLQKCTGIIFDKCWSGTLNANGLRLYTINDYQAALCVLFVTVITCFIIACSIRTPIKK